MKRTICLLLVCMAFLTSCSGEDDRDGITFTTSHTYGYYRAAVEKYNKTAKIPVKIANFDLVVSNTVKTNSSTSFENENTEQEEENVWRDLSFENYLKAVNTGLMSGKGYDIIDMTGIEYYDYENAGMLVNFDDLMEDDPTFNADDYDTRIMDLYRSENGLFVMPISYTHICWAVDNALLKQLEIEIDDDTWTWQDVASVAEKIAQAREAGLTGKYPFINTAGFIPAASLFSKARGWPARFVDKEAGSANFDTEEFISLLELFGTLGGERYVHPSTVSGQGNLIATIEDGFFAFCDLSTYDMRTFKDRFAEYRLLKMPSLPGADESSAYLSGRIYAINKNSPHVDEAWEFIKVLLSKEMQDMISKRDGADYYAGFPVRLDSKARLAGYMEQLNKNNEVYRSYNSRIEMSDIKYIDGFISELGATTHYDYELEKIVYTEAEKYFSGMKSAEEAAQSIQNKVTLYLAE